MVVSRLSPIHTSLTAEDFLEVHKWWTRDAKVAMIDGLSVLELCLVSDIYGLLQGYYLNVGKFASPDHLESYASGSISSW
jgi:hypothetical protein